MELESGDIPAGVLCRMCGDMCFDRTFAQREQPSPLDCGGGTDSGLGGALSRISAGNRLFDDPYRVGRGENTAWDFYVLTDNS